MATPQPPASQPAPSNPVTRLRQTPSSTRTTFSWSIYALSAFLFLLSTASTADAQLSPLLDGGLHSASRTHPALCPCKTEGAKKHNALYVVEACMIPVLVIISGILAGLTLGYMSLDGTQLEVLAKTGTEKQQYYAKRVIPIRKDGHLLLITLLIANMIVNETLPVIADGVLGGGVIAVVISTVLVIIFSEIIPQSICSRFGLAIGSAMVGPVRVLIWCFFIISWPVARMLEYLLGAHSGVVYRRAELKELINLHGDGGGHGGDLQKDTITIVGATLDLQTKVVSDAMTPISNIFQLPITAILDYETLGRVLKAGHSRVPVFKEISVNGKTRNKVVGVLLTKQLILLDPADAIPLADIPINPLPTISEDLPLLQILNTFQEGRSHMAIVCRRRPGYNPLGTRASFSQSIPEDGGFAKETLSDSEKVNAVDSDMEKGEATGEQSTLRSLFGRRKGRSSPTAEEELVEKASLRSSFSLAPDDDSPVGIITLEDVLEELIGEEIYDETDYKEGEEPAFKAYIPPSAIGRIGVAAPPLASPPLATDKPNHRRSITDQLKGMMVRGRSFQGKSKSMDVTTSDDTVQLASSSSSPPTAKLAPIATSILRPSGADPSGEEHDQLSPIKERDSPTGSEMESSTASSLGAYHGFTREPVDMTAAPPSALVTGPAPPLLSDAVLLERGRRLLVSQGVDPAAVPPLRLGAPRSQSPNVGGGGGTARFPARPPIRSGSKGSFKSPAPVGTIPVRSATLPTTQAEAEAGTSAAAVGEAEKDEEVKEAKEN